MHRLVACRRARDAATSYWFWAINYPATRLLFDGIDRARRMSNYCKGCRYDPKQTVGEDACPYNALYWDFLARHRHRLASNRRMKSSFSNLARKPADELAAIRARARNILRAIDRGERI